MSTLYLNGINVVPLLVNGTKWLIKDVDRINALNVFPVPDGDTGTNMRLTIEGGVNGIASSNEQHIGRLFKNLARSMVMSARGNSGVILSQFFKGMADAIIDKEYIDKDDLIEALNNGTKRSFKIVQTPTEGTILTVMKEAGEYVANNANLYSSIEDVLVGYLSQANITLQHTPDLLPCLKEAGVVDSGGAGFILILDGFLQALDGNMLQAVEEYTSKLAETIDNNEGYELEFILQLNTNQKDEFLQKMTEFLEKNAKDININQVEQTIKIKLKAAKPGKIIEFCEKYGEFVSFKMQNLSINESDYEMRFSPAKEFKKYAVVAVSSGEGISNAFKEMGVDEIVNGGQSMNPSSSDFIEAFKKINANNIIVFPNNKNIIMAAKQAKDNYDLANVVIMETRSIAECYAALTMLDFASDDLDTIVSDLNGVIENVVSASITYAIRDCVVDGIEIHKDDFISLLNGKIVACAQNKVDAFKMMLEKVPDISVKEVLTLITGKYVSKQETEDILNLLSQEYPNLEVGVIEGMQDIYSFIVAIE